MIEPSTSVLCTSTPPVLYVNLPLSQDYQFILPNVLLRIISFLFNVWRVCILRPMLLGPDCALLCMYAGSTKEKEWQWLAGWINILHRICEIPCPSQAACTAKLGEQIFMHLCRDVPNSVFPFFAMFPYQIIPSILRIEQCPLGK